MQFNQLEKDLVNELMGDLKKVSKLTFDDDVLEDRPFVWAILDVLILQKSSLPTFDKYDGTIDLVNHVETFTSIMDVQVYLDVMKYRRSQLHCKGSLGNDLGCLHITPSRLKRSCIKHS